MTLRQRILHSLSPRGHRLATVVFVANVMLLIITVLAVSLTLLISSTNGRRDQARNTAEQTANLIAEIYASIGEISIPNVARTVDALLNAPMTAQAFAAAHLVQAAAAAGYDTSEVINILSSITEETVLDEFWITDVSGFAYLTNVRDDQGELVPFGFSPNPAEQPQAYKFYGLLETEVDTFEVVTQPAQVREVDRNVYKYVGTNGIDQARVVQVGNQIIFSNEGLLNQALAGDRTDVSATVESELVDNIRVVGTILDHYVMASEAAGYSAEEISAHLSRITANTSIGEILVADRSGNTLYSGFPDGSQHSGPIYYPELVETVIERTWLAHPGTMTHPKDNGQYKQVSIARPSSDHIIQVGLPLYGVAGSGNILYVVYQDEAEILVERGYPEALWILNQDEELVAAAETERAGVEIGEVWNRPYNSRSPDVEQLYRLAQETGEVQSIVRLGLFNPEQRGAWVTTPIVIEGGNNIGGLVQYVNMDTIAEGILSEVRQTGLVTMLLLIFTGIATYFGSRLLTRPIEKIADAARYVETGEQPDYALIEPVASRSDEIGSLARVFQDMSIQVFNREEVLETLVSERTSELQSTNRQLRRAQRAINQDLEMAKVVQAALVREGSVDLETFTTCSRMNPAQLVGGDFVDFQVIDDVLFIVVGDVSGKGVASALFMAASQAAIKFAAAEHSHVGKITETANDRLCSQNPMGLFVTAIIAKVNLKTGVVDYVSAGHEPPYMLGQDGSRTTLPGTRGIAAGVLEEIEFNTRQIIMQPGETLFIYTDGLTDMVNTQGELYGKHRLEQILDEIGTQTPHDIVEGVWSNIAEFSAGTAAADDMTCLVLHRKTVTTEV
ncbi:MAG: SpoIIE family protein phosphatase [Bacteroidota bacterium]|nr:SpoIIE family protein phosphatase [Bacteroidota bacterium]